MQPIDYKEKYAVSDVTIVVIFQQLFYISEEAQVVTLSFSICSTLAVQLFNFGKESYA